MLDPSLLPKPEKGFNNDEEITIEDVFLIIKWILNNLYIIQIITWSIFILINLDLFLYLAFKAVGFILRVTNTVFEILIFINHNR